MTPSRVNRRWRHPLSRLSKRDPLISPQNNPPQTLSSHSLAIPPVPSRAPPPCPTTPADFLSSLAFVSERALISGANFASLSASLNYNRETPGWSCRQSHWGRGPGLQVRMGARAGGGKSLGNGRGQGGCHDIGRGWIPPTTLGSVVDSRGRTSKWLLLVAAGSFSSPG